MPTSRARRPALSVKRIYEPPAAADGARVLVDRLWPRGIARDKAKIARWLKDLAPSDALRKRFHAKPEAWDDFRKAYAAELEAAAAEAAVKELRTLMAEGPVTLLYASRDEQRNNAAALKAWLEESRRRR